MTQQDRQVQGADGAAHSQTTRKPHLLVFWNSVLSQFRRNLGLTWGSQCMTFCSVTLSVLIFSFFI